MIAPPALGTLQVWSEIVHEEKWAILLLGNGLSMNVYPYFGYTSLYTEAHEPGFVEGLTQQEQAIFDTFGTTNFELVLAKLRDGIMLAEGMGLDPNPYRERFLQVQAALGRTVRRVHVPWPEVPDVALSTIKAYLKDFDGVFSTSYDLLLYWAIVHEDDYQCFCDFFWANGRYEFDPKDCVARQDQIPVYYMHGALHLVVDGSGATRKLVKEDGRLLDQFGKATEDDPSARPLLITEGSHKDKLRAIEENDYLAHAYKSLKEASGPLLVFGNALGEQDQHLIEAINAYPGRPVAISMVDEGVEQLRNKQARIRGSLRTDEVTFYDAATHPLGSSNLRARTARERDSNRWRPSRLASS